MSASSEVQRRKAASLSRVMRSISTRCDSCRRGQNPRVEYDPICAGSVWVCRYCKHVHLTTT